MLRILNKKKTKEEKLNSFVIKYLSVLTFLHQKSYPPSYFFFCQALIRFFLKRGSWAPLSACTL